MLTNWLAVVASVASVASAARSPLSGVSSSYKTSSKVLANTYIIELDSVAAVHSAGSRRANVRGPHGELYQHLAARGVSYTVRKEFTTELFTGVSLHLPETSDITDLKSIPGVKSFTPVSLWDRPAPASQHVLSGPKDSAVTPTDSLSTHTMTGVDKLHAAGYTGKGIIVGIIDTGTDYTHPYLGKGFGPGHKVAAGYDFVGDAFTGSNTPVPDDDPLDQCAGHGTHVAGIVAADPGNEYGISGVAYESTIYSYRVFGCEGSTPDDVIVESLTRAYNDGSDVITLSLGGPDAWTESVGGVVASRIADKGRIVTIAAGNEGAEGSWYASGPATGVNVISVASVENTRLPAQNITVSDGKQLSYLGLQPIAKSFPAGYPADTPLPIYVLSKDTTVTADGCTALPDSTPDLSGKVVIVRRGTCTFVTKFANIAAKGGKVALVYDNIVESVFSPSVDPYIGTLISKADGEYLANAFFAGQNLTLKFPSVGVSADVPNADGGLVSTFSTYGPSFDLYFKPAFGAPGGKIPSTWPTTLGSWAVLDGTSMATPFVAGSAALLFQKRGKSLATAKSARSLFETTALAIASDKTGASPLQTLTQAGAGLIQVDRALNYATVLTPGEILLNDTAHFNGVQFLTLKNTGKKTLTYTLEHVPAGTAQTIREGSVQPELYPVPLSTDYAQVSIIPSKVVVLPGLSAKVLVTILPPKTGDKSRFPVYSGFIQATSNTNETLHTSYLGLNAKTTDLQVIDTSDYYFGIPLPTVLDEAGEEQTPGENYTLSEGDYPLVLYRLAVGTPALYFDLVTSNTTFKPTYSKREEESASLFARNWWNPWFSKPGSGTFGKVATVGPLATFKYQSRNTDDTVDNGGYSTLGVTSFANGTAIPKGSYKVLVRALKIAGDATAETSYESWLSTPFLIV